MSYSNLAKLEPKTRPATWAVRRSASDAGVYRMRQTTEIAYRLQEAAQEAARLSDDAAIAEAWAVSDMLLEAGRPENIFTADDLCRLETGECFDGYGSLVVTGSRLDPAYMAVSSRRARKRVREALAQVRPQVGEHLRLLTVTMPHLQGFTASLDVFDAALVLLKKRQWFKQTIRAAVVGCEFTVTATGYHVHAHILAWSKWVRWDEFGRQWTECLERAASALGVKMDFDTAHGRAVVDVRLVKRQATHIKDWRTRNIVGLDDAINEVCKYVVKGSDFDKVPASELIAIEQALYRRRMVETFGECARSAKQAVSGREPYLDTQGISDGKQSDSEPVKRPRSESLRLIGARMIREGRRAAWLEYLKRVVEKRRRWRKRQLAQSEQGANATFRTLDGQTWHGVAVSGEPCGVVVPFEPSRFPLTASC